jgi:hypothetical protein
MMAGDKIVEREASLYYWEANDGSKELDITATMDMST